MSVDKTTSSRSHEVRRTRSLTPEIEALFIEGVIENDAEALEWAELGEDASWEALQIVDPDPIDVEGLVWPEKK
jgi:hypothetical protein